jgi:hypothetical protein
MAAPFSARADRRLRLTLLVLVVLGIATVWAALAWRSSSYVTGVGVAVSQPVDFNHELHAGRLGIDCRFCHTGVDRGARAGLPTTETCMICHSQIWQGAAPLAAVRESFTSDEPLAWNRLHRLPDHARFHHAIHLDQGVGCETCHGRVDRMQKTVKVVDMTMAWCLDCHRAPASRLRPPEAVFSFGWREAPHGDARAMQNNVRDSGLSDCSVCHY